MAPPPQRGCAPARARPAGSAGPASPASPAMAPPPAVLCLFDVDGTLTAPRQASAGRAASPRGAGGMAHRDCEPAGSGADGTPRLPARGERGGWHTVTVSLRGAGGMAQRDCEP